MTMRVFIETREAKRGFNCPRCSHRTRTCEWYIATVVLETGKQIERCCIHCKAIAKDDADYNYTLVAPPEEGEDDERHLRRMEAYSAYAAAGCTAVYWDDLNNGYID